MQVFVTGGTGFVGNAVVDTLLTQGHQVRALLRKGSEEKLPQRYNPALATVNGDITDSPETLAQAMAGCDAVIHLVGIIREFPKRGITFETLHYQGSIHVIEGAKLAGIPRFVHMSALGVNPQATAPYLTTKQKAEEHLQQSGLDWTIFRPSGIFGPKDDMFNFFAELLQKAPFTPVIGDGSYLLQPVALETVAEAFVRSLKNTQSIGKIYDLGGPKSYSYNDILRIIGRTIGRSVRLLHVPLGIMKPLVRAFESIPAFPITTNQLTMLLAGNATDDFSAYDDLGLTPIDFEQTIAGYMGKDLR